MLPTDCRSELARDALKSAAFSQAARVNVHDDDVQARADRGRTLVGVTHPCV